MEEGASLGLEAQFALEKGSSDPNPKFRVQVDMHDLREKDLIRHLLYNL